VTHPTWNKLLKAVERAYAANPDAMDNGGLYQSVMGTLGMTQMDFWSEVPIGAEGEPRSVPARMVRWSQQTLKAKGLLEKVPGSRAVWRLTGRGRRQLCQINRGMVLVAFHTDLGLALWADCRDAMAYVDRPIMCVITSPPFPLHTSRAYSNVSPDEYVDFICSALEPVISKMAPQGSIVLNLSNDIFMPGSPARHTYLERLVLALQERLGIWLMDRMIWSSNKPPGPIRYCSLKRTLLHSGFEFVYWFALNPLIVKSNNQRVLEQHTQRHLKFLEAGGINYTKADCDGAHRKRPGGYGRVTAGRIPRNVLSIASSCGSQRNYKRAARALGLKPHGAPMPLRLADFLVKFLTDRGDVVADIMAGSLTLGVAAEENDRTWLLCETAADYLRGGAERFRGYQGLWVNPVLDEALGLDAAAAAP
jgi:DNA modification methylase